MHPYDDLAGQEPDYGDVALLLASAREWPSEDFARELDARVAHRFVPEAAARARGGRGRIRVRLSRWTAGPAVALVAGVVAAVAVLSGGGSNPTSSFNGPLAGAAAPQHGAQHRRQSSPEPGGVVNTTAAVTDATTLGQALTTPAQSATGSVGESSNFGVKQAGVNHGTVSTTSATSYGANSLSPGVPVAPGSKQIRAAQITLATANQHVDQVASEVFNVVSAEHGSVLSSHVTTATNSAGGGYASFSLSIPTGNLQDAMTQLSRLHYAALRSSSDASQNVSGQYNSDQRQLADAQALRASLLKQLQTAYTQQAIDSIKAQLKLAEQQINSAQATLGSLNHRISYSDVSVQVNSGGLPVPVTHKSTFTIGSAGHDALRVLVVSAGVAMIALAVAIPVGLVAALLMWLWVWVRQRRREHALDAAA